MVVIGVTGSVGTGKSTVARMFGALGAEVLDADAITHELTRPNQPVWRKIVKRFGPRVVRENGSLCREELARQVFRDPAKRKALERIVHPAVLAEIRRRIRELRQRRNVKAVVADVPLLVETGSQQWMDALVVVTARPAQQRARLRAKFGWSRKQIEARRRAQMPQAAKVALADHVIDNTGSVGATRTQVNRLWKQLLLR